MRRCFSAHKVWRYIEFVFVVAIASAPTWSPVMAWQAREDAQPPQASGLYRADAVQFSASAPSSMLWPLECDASGNIYETLAKIEPSSPVVEPKTVVGIFPSSKKVIQYTLPSVSGYRPLVVWSFGVGPGGKVYVLANTAREESDGTKLKPTWFVVEYNDDGTVDSRFTVRNEQGKRLQPLRMAVFGDGNLLLSGTTVLDAGMGTFADIFDRQGTFITSLKLGEAMMRGKSESADEPSGLLTKFEPAPEEPPRAGQVTAGAKNPVAFESSTLTVSSQDGNIYALQGTSETTLNVISPAGDVVRQYHLKPPELRLSPLQMGQAGVGYLFIYYSWLPFPNAPNTAPKASYLEVLNSQTGKTAALYRLPKGEGGFAIPACAVSPDDFEFLGASKDNHLEIVRYVSR